MFRMYNHSSIIDAHYFQKTFENNLKPWETIEKRNYICMKGYIAIMKLFRTMNKTFMKN